MVGVLFDVILVGLLLLMVFIMLNSMRIIRPNERGVVERFGKYHRTLTSGLNFIAPYAETIRKVDMRETMIDVPEQEIITKDNVGVAVDTVIYYQVVDPFRVLYNVAGFEEAAIKLSQTHIRNIMANMNLDETLTSREKINVELRQVLDDATDKWGVRITRVEIQKIIPPSDITEAMSRQMKAERTRRAVILESEGIKQSAILRAEGERQAHILEAEGKAKAVEMMADAERYKKIAAGEGESEAILKVFNAMHSGKPTKDILTLKYLESLQKMADGRSTKIFFPVETSGLLGGIAALGEAFRETRTLRGDINRVGKLGTTSTKTTEKQPSKEK